MTKDSSTDWRAGYSLGRIAELACIIEVTASKPGNVHRGADFADVSLVDFLASAVAMGQAIDGSSDVGYGETVLRVAKQTRKVANSNTNLGMNLLITAMAKALSMARSLTQSGDLPEKLTTEIMSTFLRSLTLEDSQKVFEAIRLMKPGGMGEAPQHNVANEPTVSLVEAMQLAADRDSVAAQFVTDFEQVISHVPTKIEQGMGLFGNLLDATVFVFVSLMAKQPDSLIARKCGVETANKSQVLAAKAIEEIDKNDSLDSYWRSVSELDFWLRSDGHRRNPGTSADLVAAGIFVAAYNGTISPPFR